MLGAKVGEREGLCYRERDSFVQNQEAWETMLRLRYQGTIHGLFDNESMRRGWVEDGACVPNHKTHRETEASNVAPGSEKGQRNARPSSEHATRSWGVFSDGDKESIFASLLVLVP
jgi:hypothetical protein